MNLWGAHMNKCPFFSGLSAPHTLPLMGCSSFRWPSSTLRKARMQAVRLQNENLTKCLSWYSLNNSKNRKYGAKLDELQTSQSGFEQTDSSILKFISVTVSCAIGYMKWFGDFNFIPNGQMFTSLQSLWNGFLLCNLSRDIKKLRGSENLGPIWTTWSH